RYPGAPQLALTVLALIVMGLRGRRISGTDSAQAGIGATVRPFKPMSARSMRRGLLIAAGFIVVWPLIIPFSVLNTSLTWIELTLAAMSLVVLVGWVGQILLAQATFVGIAALITGLVSNGWGLGFPVSSLFAAAVAGGVAMLLGVVALRIRGLYL